MTILIKLGELKVLIEQKVKISKEGEWIYYSKLLNEINVMIEQNKKLEEWKGK